MDIPPNSDVSANAVGSSSEKEFVPGYKTVDDFVKAGYRAVLEMTKTSNTLPNEDHFHYYSSYPAFEDAMVKQGNQCLRSVSNVMQSSGIKGNIMRRDLEEKFELLLDANDTLLERVATNLDEVAGIRKNPVTETPEARKTSRPLSGIWNQSPSTFTNNDQVMRSPTISPSVRKMMPKVSERPQLKFADKIDNSPSKPFEPIIKEKPNALKPLSILLLHSDFGECFSHPYEYELDMFNPPENQLTKVEPKLPRTEHIPLKFVESLEDLNSMVKQLKNVTELAVDLEHHNYRSFQGFTCLMQISTRHSDFIVDTLKLRGNLQVLNEIFTNPKCVKVFHGSDSDVEWLQRDLGLYVVNMFDTHQAGKLLNLPRLSLAYLVKYYCDFEMDKSYQLADWRIRPIPAEMIEYARLDTHYLLYIYDRLKCDLWELGMNTDRLIKSAIGQSTQICKKIYIKPQLDNDGHLKLYRKSRKMFNNRQLWAMKEIFAWRFNVAMNEDESASYVLPNHMLLQISETLPREMQGILACCNPIPALVRQNLATIHRIVLQARQQPLIQTEATEENASRTTQTEWTKINIESSLHCPHQLPQKDEQPDLPSLLGTNKPEICKANGILKDSATIAIFSAFNSKASGLDENQKDVMSPYQRYLLVKPYMQHLSNIAALKEAEANQQKPQKVAHVTQPNLQRMEQIHMHFEQLDSRTAAQNAPPPCKEPSDEEDDDESPCKKLKLDGVKEEDVLEFSDIPPPAEEERIKSFRPGKRNLSVNEARSKFDRNKKNQKNKKKSSGNNWQQAGPARVQPDNRRQYNPDEDNGHQQQNQARGQKRNHQGQRGGGQHQGQRGGGQHQGQRGGGHHQGQRGGGSHQGQRGARHQGQQGPQHQGQRGPPQEERVDQAGPSQEQFNYDQIDYTRFQGGSKVNNKRNFRGNNRGNRGKNQKKRFNFPQRQNQKSHTYKA